MNSCPLDSFMSQFIGSTIRGRDLSHVTIVCDNAKVTSSRRRANNVAYPQDAFVSKGSSNTSDNDGRGRVHFKIICDEAIAVCESTPTRAYSKNTRCPFRCESTVGVLVSNDGPKPKIERHSSSPLPMSHGSFIPSLPPARRAAMFDECSSSLDKAPRLIQRSQSLSPRQRSISC